MYTFQVKTEWHSERKCRASARDNPNLIVATPPEFGGPEGIWSPEELFVVSVGSCLLSTFLFFVHRFKIAFESYESTSTGTLGKTPDGLRFTGVDVSIAVTVANAEMAEKIASLRLSEKLEKYCPESTSLKCPVHLVLEVLELPDSRASAMQSL